MNAIRTTTIWIYAPLAAVSVLLLALIANAHPWAAVDDAFITYRYADNLRHGLGFVYNPGEAVLGTTTPLFGLLLGTIGWFLPGVEMAVIGFWVAGLAWIAAVWMAALLFLQLKQPTVALLAALFVAIQPVMITNLGMETSLVIFLMLASAWAWQQERRLWAVLFSALLILARQDGALWVLLLGAQGWRRSGRLPWRETLATVALCLPWFLFSWWQYGSVLPNSVLAKAGQIERMSVSGIIPVWHYFWTVLIGSQNVVYGFLVIIAAVTGVYVVARHQPSLWWLPVWGILYLLIYQMLGVVSFIWYFLPPLVVVSLLAALGVGTAMKATLRGPLRWPFSLLLLIALAFLVGVRFQWLSSERVRFDSANPQLSLYHEAGRWLAENTAADAKVATIEIGAIGYHIPNPILDTMGLVSPEMRPGLTGWSDSLIYALTTFWPDYAIVLPNTAWDGVVTQWWFQKYFGRVAQFDNISIYQREGKANSNFILLPNATYLPGLVLQEVQAAGQNLATGTDLEVWFQFVVEAEQPSNYQFTFYWIDAQTGERSAIETIWPFYLEGAYPSDRWPAGQTIQMPIRVSVPENLAPGSYRLGLFIFDPQIGKGLPLADAPDVDYPEVQIGYFRLGDPSVPPPAEEITERMLQARWQEGIELTSVAVPNHPLGAGDVLPIRLDWRAHAETERNLTVFLHVLNADGEIVAQSDRRPFDGRFPTAVWRVDEELSDTMLVALPQELTAGSYSIRVGLYDEAGRLGRESGDGDNLTVDNIVALQDAP